MSEIHASFTQILAPEIYVETVFSITTYSAPQASVVKEILKERDYQDDLWGAAFDRALTNGQWLDMIRDYAYGNGRAKGYEFRKRMIKVAAIALAAVESEDGKASRS